MKTETRILIVDDHQLFLNGIEEGLKSMGFTNITSCTNCDLAYQLITNAEGSDTFDLLLTDLSFPSTNSKVLDSGESLIKKVKELNLDIKVGVLTGHTETNRIYNVIHNLNPDGYLLKNSCDALEIGFAIQKILNGEIYYSQEVHQKLNRRSLLQIKMDDTAIQILKELPKQHKISNLEGIIMKNNGDIMKLRTIESKLSNLRIDLNAHNNADLVLKAKELGIID